MIIGIDATNIRMGGGITHIVELINNIDASASQIKKIIIWGNYSSLDQMEDREWLNKITITNNNGLIKQLNWQLFKLKKNAVSLKCDILFVPGGNYIGFFNPFVAMSQNMLPFEYREIIRYGLSKISLRLIILRLFQAYTFKRANRLIFLSNFARNTISDTLNLNKEKSVIIPHGVLQQPKSKIKIQKSIKKYDFDNPFKIVYVSSIDPYKHQWNVIEAIAKLRSEGYPLSLYLIGSAYPKSLKKMLKYQSKFDSNGEWSFYTGELKRSEVIEKLNDCNLGVFASSCENLPNIILEKMAAGLPIASSNYGPMSEMLGNFGQYFDPTSVDGIYEVIKKLIQSQSLRQKLVKNNLLSVGKYSWKNCSNETFSYIIQTINKKIS